MNNSFFNALYFSMHLAQTPELPFFLFADFYTNFFAISHFVRELFGFWNCPHFPGVVPVAFWFVLVKENNRHIESFYFVPVALYFDNIDIFI